MKSMGRTPWWLWPNLLSLDAPILAVLWQDFLSRRYSVPLRAPGRLALFVTVWAIYVADRLLDARRPADGAEAARHAFYRRHQKFATWLLAIQLGVALTIAVFWLRPAVLVNGLVPFAAVLVYLGVLNLRKRSGPIAKELVVAFVFTAGTFLVAWTNDPASPVALLGPAAAFFLLCLANLAAIEKWEWEELRAGSDAPHVTTRGMVRSVTVTVPLLAAVALWRGKDPWYLAIGLSATAIAALVFSGRRISLELRRVLVDAALLSPLFVWASR